GELALHPSAEERLLRSAQALDRRTDCLLRLDPRLAGEPAPCLADLAGWALLLLHRALAFVDEARRACLDDVASGGAQADARRAGQAEIGDRQRVQNRTE